MKLFRRKKLTGHDLTSILLDVSNPAATPWRATCQCGWTMAAVSSEVGREWHTEHRQRTRALLWGDRGYRQ